jgi:hypothetical protein
LKKTFLKIFQHQNFQKSCEVIYPDKANDKKSQLFVARGQEKKKGKVFFS